MAFTALSATDVPFTPGVMVVVFEAAPLPGLTAAQGIVSVSYSADDPTTALLTSTGVVRGASRSVQTRITRTPPTLPSEPGTWTMRTYREIP